MGTTHCQCCTAHSNNWTFATWCSFLYWLHAFMALNILMPRPHPLIGERVWWLLGDFLVVPSQQVSIRTNIDYMLAWYRAYFIALCECLDDVALFHCFAQIETADSAQTRNHSIVTSPFSTWEGGVWARDIIGSLIHSNNAKYIAIFKLWGVSTMDLNRWVDSANVGNFDDG